jgi:iron complex outermembrane receptor protein
LDAAVRTDHYTDVGNTTNPKVGFRYQPLHQILFRGSYNTGFRAPTLFEENSPFLITNTANAYADPFLVQQCLTSRALQATAACGGLQQNIVQQGSKQLSPEKSSTGTLGIVLEPMRGLTASVDYWNIVLKSRISALGESAIFGDPVKYKSQFVRCSTVAVQNPTAYATLLANGSCDPTTGFDLLAYIYSPNQNEGKIKTQGLDLGLNWTTPTDFGRVTFNFEGTYTLKYDYQVVADGPYKSAVGKYNADLSSAATGAVANPVIFRWQHVLSVDVGVASWDFVAAERFKSGYQDQNDPTQLSDPSFADRVGSYSVWDLGAQYKGIKRLTLNFGIRNAFNKTPPFSNQGSTFQVGYDPRYTDPLDRTYLFRAQLDFK